MSSFVVPQYVGASLGATSVAWNQIRELRERRRELRFTARVSTEICLFRRSNARASEGYRGEPVRPRHREHVQAARLRVRGRTRGMRGSFLFVEKASITKYSHIQLKKRGAKPPTIDASCRGSRHCCFSCANLCNRLLTRAARRQKVRLLKTPHLGFV